MIWHCLVLRSLKLLLNQKSIEFFKPSLNNNIKSGNSIVNKEIVWEDHKSLHLTFLIKLKNFLL